MRWTGLSVARCLLHGSSGSPLTDRLLPTQLLADKAEASEIAVKGIIEIVSKTDRWKKAAILFYTQPDIETAATELFVEILGFLTLAKKQLEVGSWSR